MSRPVIPLLRWQFDLTWSLFEIHLTALTDEDHLWEPATRCWTVRKTPDGTWLADWAETEPDPPPAATIGWLTWHIGWWWTAASRGLCGDSPQAAHEVPWPGSAAVTADWLRGLRADWLAELDQLTEDALDAVAPFPWQNDPEHTVAHLLGWVNAELMKNVAEVGQLRLLRLASNAP